MKHGRPSRETGKSWFGFSAVRAIPGTGDEVLLIPLPGHTRGHCGVAVRRSDDWLLHCGDAYFHHSEVAPGAGQAPKGLSWFEARANVDSAQRRANQARLRELARLAGDRVKLVCSHDPGEFAAMSSEAREAPPAARPTGQRSTNTPARGDLRKAIGRPRRSFGAGRACDARRFLSVNPEAEDAPRERPCRQDPVTPASTANSAPAFGSARERGGIEARPRRGHEQPVELVAAKRAAGDLRAGQFNNSIDAPVRRVAHDASAAPLRVPQAAVAIDGRSVRGARSPKRRKHPLAGQCAAVEVIVISANDLCRRVREIHAPAVG